MPCPFYKNGLCTSPRLSSPSPSVTSRQRCLGEEPDYMSCSYYVEAESTSTGSLAGYTLETALGKQFRPYVPIHVVASKPKSECPYIKIHDYGGGYLAQCQVIERLLTRSEIKLCENYWKTCPLYRQANKYT